MKRVIIILLGIFSMGLCAVMFKQWEVEARLRHIIQEISDQLIVENTARTEAERKVRDYEKEIIRLTTLRAEIEAKLLVATEEVRDRTDDQSSRGYSIAILMNQIISAESELRAYKGLASKGTDAIKARNEVVTEQNAAILKANAQLKSVVAERDEAIGRLNARTREFNELVEKYNKLSKAQ